MSSFRQASAIGQAPTLGGRLREVRLALRLTGAQIAGRLDVSRGYWSAIENDKDVPGPKLLKALAREFGIEAAMLRRNPAALAALRQVVDDQVSKLVEKSASKSHLPKADEGVETPTAAASWSSKQVEKNAPMSHLPPGYAGDRPAPYGEPPGLVPVMLSERERCLIENYREAAESGKRALDQAGAALAESKDVKRSA